MSAHDDKSFALACLEAHNIYRDMHGCPPLQLNEKLSAEAKLWAQHLLKINTLIHSTSKEFGENIYMAGGSNITGSKPVQAWYDEIENYNFEEATFKPSIGHFTQVIWKSSKELGVGKAQKDRIIYVVARYTPAGNVRGHFKEQVPRKIKDIAPFANKKSESLANTFNAEVPRLSKPRKYLDISAEDTIFQTECLEAHNKYRAMHHVPPLKLNEMLTQYATYWAQTLAESNQLRHSPTNAYGENIYRTEGVRINGALPVRIWYEQGENYDFDGAKFSPQAGGFTQVVWKDTRELGVGVVRNYRDNSTIVVASYYPPGNVEEEFEQSVFPRNSKVRVEKEIAAVEKAEVVPASTGIDVSTQAAISPARENKQTQISTKNCECPQKKKFSLFCCFP